MYIISLIRHKNHILCNGISKQADQVKTFEFFTSQFKEMQIILHFSDIQSQEKEEHPPKNHSSWRPAQQYVII